MDQHSFRYVFFALLLLTHSAIFSFANAEEPSASKKTTESVTNNLEASQAKIKQDKETLLEQGPPTKEGQEKLSKEATKVQQEIIDDAIQEFKVTDENGNDVICSKEDTVAIETDGKVNYRCRTTTQALGETNDTQQGEGETNQLIDELFIESKQADDKEIKLSTEQIQAITDAQEIQQQKSQLELPPSKEEYDNELAEKESEQNEESTIIFKQKDDGELQVKTKESPSQGDTAEVEDTSTTNKVLETSDDEAAQIVLVAEEKQRPLTKPLEWIQKIPVKAYLSLRATYKHKNTENKLQDGLTRFGFIYAKKLENEDRLILHVEAGTNIIEQVRDYAKDKDPQSNQLKSRLAYFRYGREDYYTVIGKNWSVYHYIASMTDKFNSVGGKATGIYNAGSDGGATGTGRATKAIQLRSSRGIFQWGTQLQSDTEIPVFGSSHRYSLNAALMGKIKFLNGFGLGASYLKAVPEDITTDMIANGFNGETNAAVLGAEWKIAEWDFAITTAKNSNLVTDDQLYYYDALGAEFYTTTKFTPLTQFRFGLAYQTPSNTNVYQGKHEVVQAYIGWQYNYNKNNFSDRIFIEYAQNEGKLADGSKAHNTLNIGIRYNLQN